MRKKKKKCNNGTATCILKSDELGDVGFMTRTGDRKIRSYPGRFPDNLGELVTLESSKAVFIARRCIIPITRIIRQDKHEK